MECINLKLSKKKERSYELMDDDYMSPIADFQNKHQMVVCVTSVPI